MTFTPRTRAEFDALVPDEDAAERLLIKLRWPNGVSCPECGSFDMNRLRTRKIWECRQCRKHTSIRSGTALHGTRIPLRDWLFAIWRNSAPSGVSAAMLARELGRRYETVWVMLHKIRATLAGRGWPIAGPVLSGTAEIPVRKRAKGDPRHRPPVLVGLLVAPDLDARDHLRIEMSCGPDQTDAELRDEAHLHHLEPLAEVQVETDRKRSGARGTLGWARHRIALWLKQVFRGVSRRYLGNYLAQYVYSQNRWHKRKDGGLARWVGRRVVQEPWRPRSLLAPTAP